MAPRKRTLKDFAFLVTWGLAWAAHGQDTCKVSQQGPVETANGRAGYEFTYQSSTGQYPDQSYCFVYDVSNKPKRPKTDVRWTGNISGADPFIDNTIAACPADPCPPEAAIRNTTSSIFGRALWPSTLGWGLNKSQFQRRPLAWQDPGSGQKGAVHTSGTFPSLRTILEGGFVSSDDKVFRIQLALISSVLGSGPYVLKYELRTFGDSSPFVLAISEDQTADFPVVVWRAAQSEPYLKYVSGLTTERRTLRKAPSELSIVLENVKAIEVGELLGVTVAWKGKPELRAKAPAYLPHRPT